MLPKSALLLQYKFSNAKKLNHGNIFNQYFRPYNRIRLYGFHRMVGTKEWQKPRLAILFSRRAFHALVGSRAVIICSQYFKYHINRTIRRRLSYGTGCVQLQSYRNHSDGILCHFLATSTSSLAFSPSPNSWKNVLTDVHAITFRASASSETSSWMQLVHYMQLH